MSENIQSCHDVLDIKDWEERKRAFDSVANLKAYCAKHINLGAKEASTIRLTEEEQEAFDANFLRYSFANTVAQAQLNAFGNGWQDRRPRHEGEVILALPDGRNYVCEKVSGGMLLYVLGADEFTRLE